MIQMKDEIKKSLDTLFDELWEEKNNSLPDSEVIVKSVKLDINGELIKVILTWVDDNNIVIKIKQQKG